MDGIVLLLFILAAIAFGKSAGKKKPAPPVQRRGVPAETVRPVSPAAPLQPTVAPKVAPKAAPAKKQETHAHVHSNHVVAPSFYTGHAHEESSLSGSTLSCAPVEVRKAPVEKAADVSSGSLPPLEFDSDSVLKGLLYAEILGKPKALR